MIIREARKVLVRFFRTIYASPMKIGATPYCIALGGLLGLFVNYTLLMTGITMNTQRVVYGVGIIVGALTRYRQFGTLKIKQYRLLSVLGTALFILCSVGAMELHPSFRFDRAGGLTPLLAGVGVLSLGMCCVMGRFGPNWERRILFGLGGVFVLLGSIYALSFLIGYYTLPILNGPYFEFMALVTAGLIGHFLYKNGQYAPRFYDAAATLVQGMTNIAYQAPLSVIVVVLGATFMLPFAHQGAAFRFIVLVAFAAGASIKLVQFSSSSVSPEETAIFVVVMANIMVLFITVTFFVIVSGQDALNLFPAFVYVQLALNAVLVPILRQ